MTFLKRERKSNRQFQNGKKFCGITYPWPAYSPEQ